jgi:hypothetical protein
MMELRRDCSEDENAKSICGIQAAHMIVIACDRL